MKDWRNLHSFYHNINIHYFSQMTSLAEIFKQQFPSPWNKKKWKSFLPFVFQFKIHFIWFRLQLLIRYHQRHSAEEIKLLERTKTASATSKWSEQRRRQFKFTHCSNLPTIRATIRRDASAAAALTTSGLVAALGTRHEGTNASECEWRTNEHR